MLPHVSEDSRHLLEVDYMVRSVPGYLPEDNDGA